MKFTAAQTARGLYTTFQRGDYSLVVARLQEVSAEGGQRTEVLRLFEKLLSKEERTVWNKYESRI